MVDENGLTPRQKMFADEWLTGAATGQRFNGLAAYKHAGYSIPESNPYTNASKLLRHPKVKAYIDKTMKALSMGPEEALMRITALARAEVGEAIEVDELGNISLNHKIVKQRLAHAIKSFKYDSNGVPQVEFHDSLGALRDILKALGITKDGLEITGSGGGPAVLQVQFVEADGTQAVMPGVPHKPEAEDDEDFSDIDAEG